MYTLLNNLCHIMDLFNINYLLNISFLIVYFKSQLAELSNKQYDNFGKRYIFND